MAITNGYVTLDEYKAYADTGSSVNVEDDAVIEDAIEGASRYIDGQTGDRTFYARTETRKFSVPRRSRELSLDDDLLTITALTNGDGNTIASTEYNLMPINNDPKFAIKLKQSSSTIWEFDGNGNTEFVISVTGTWGFAATAPTDIQRTCIELSRSALQRRKAQDERGITITAAGVVIAAKDESDFVRKTIRFYKRRVH